MKIVQTPNPVLTQKTKPVTKIDKKILAIIRDMKKTLIDTDNPQGVGLAAPQIGISSSVFIARPGIKSPIRVFINPEIVWMSPNLAAIDRPSDSRKSLQKDRKLEGCLSISNVWGYLKRAHQLRLKYQDEKGQAHTESFSGFLATIIQHEVDHLNGILFTVRVLEQKQKLYRIITNEKDEEELEEIPL